MRQHPIGRIIEETPNHARWLGIGTLVIFGVMGAIFIIKYFPDNTICKTDFLAVYVMPNAIWHGDDISTKIDDLAKKYVGELNRKYFDFPSHHPPTLGLVLLPLAWFEYYTAQRIWYLCEIVFLLLTIRNLFLVAGVRLQWPWLILYTLAFAMINPSMGDLNLGQTTCFMVYLLSAMWLALKHNKDGLAGILWGISLMLKQLAWPLAFVLIVHKKYRTLLTACVCLLAGYLICGIIIGFPAIARYYFKTLPTLYEYHVNSPWNSALWAIGKRMTDGAYFESSNMPVFSLTPAFPNMKFLPVLPYIIPVTVLIFSLIQLIRHNDFDGSFALFSGLILLINPITWDYFYLFALIPLTRVVMTLYAKKFPYWETHLALFSFVTIAVNYAIWIELSILIENGTWFLKDTSKILHFHFFNYLFVYVPTLGAFILSFLAARPVEIPQRSVEKPTREE